MSGFYRVSHDALLVGALSLLFVFNYAIQQSPVAGHMYHLFSLSYVALILYCRLRSVRLCIVLMVFYFICFHQYGADPYGERLLSYLSGPYKVVVLGVWLSCFDTFYKKRLFWVFLFFIPILYQFLFGGAFRSEYFVNDMLYYFFLLSVVLVSKIKGVEFVDIGKLVYFFSLTLPFHFVVVYVLGLGSELFGSYYFFYGHLISFIMLFGFVYRISNKECKSIISFALATVNAVVFFQAAQSAYFVMILLSLLAVIFLTGNMKGVIFGGLSVAGFLVVYLVVPAGSWMALKLGQVVGMISLAGGGDLASINSLAIRVATFNAIASSSDLFEIFVGRGPASIYTDIDGYLAVLNLHDATFPVGEVESGEYHMIHESVVRLFMHYGAIGVGALSLLCFGMARLVKDDLPSLLAVLFFFFFWMSGVQFMGFICLFLSVMQGSLKTKRSAFEVLANGR